MQWANGIFSFKFVLKLYKWILSNTAPTTRYVFLLFCSIFPLFGKTFDFLGVTKNCFAYYYLDNSKVLNLRNSATRFTVQWYLPAYQKFTRSDLHMYQRVLWELLTPNFFILQVNNYEIVVNFFHTNHNLTWYSAIVHKFTRIYPVCSTYELTKQFM